MIVKCEKCHTEKGWKELTFKHDSSDFRLKGKHGKVKCAECHAKDTRGMTLYRPIDHKRCDNSGCHDVEKRGAIHGRQFAGKDCADLKIGSNQVI